MALSKVRLGDYLKLYRECCGIADLTCWDVSGVNKNKEFFEPAKQVGEDTSNYKIVPPDYFACNLMHIGRDVVLPIALNRTSKNKYVSPAYTVFCLVNEDLILKDYLFMYLNSSEKDRFFWFHCDGSVRDGMDWNVFCDMEIEVPSIEIQQKYVDIYQGMVNNQRAYERGLEDLKLVCDGYIEDLRRKMPSEAIGKYIVEQNIRNNNLAVVDVQGVNNASGFGVTKADTAGLDFHNYKIVYESFFTYNPSRINIGSIALRRENVPPCIVSPMYIVFSVIDSNVLLPEYLMLWFARKEFQRSTLFYATGSVRDTFDFSNMREVKIPIPDIEVQKSIVNIYKVYNIRKEINERLKSQIKDICPILIKGSIDEAR